MRNTDNAGTPDFDNFLRRALTEANMADFRDIMENAEYINPVFSRRYMRERARMLENPMGWIKRKIRPVWKKILQSAACVALAALVTLGALMAVSPRIRAAVINWLRELHGNMIIYSGTGMSAHGVASDWRPAWVPDGWTLRELDGIGGSAHWSFERLGDKKLDILSFYCLPASEGNLTTALARMNASKGHTTVSVRGYPADLFEGPSNSVLVWQDRDGNLLCLAEQQGDSELLREIAEHIERRPEDGTAYEAAWIPDGYREISDFQFNGAGSADWISYHGSTLIFQYAADLPCAFQLPDESTENVIVNGAPALYWKAKKSHGADDNMDNRTVTIDGVEYRDTSIFETENITVFTGITGDMELNVLSWTDSESNTTFAIRSDLEWEEILKIAENVCPCERRPLEDHPASYTFFSGTVYPTDPDSSGTDGIANTEDIEK